MSTIEKLSIAVTKDMATMLQEAVKSGEYASHSEVIRDALRDWKMKRAMRQQQIIELRRQIQEGIDSPSDGPLDMEDIKREARRRFETERQKSE